MGTRSSARTLQPKRPSRLLRSTSICAAVAAAAFAFSGGSGRAYAGDLTITDANSSTTINDSSQFGQSSYTVDGKNILVQDWFWYRLGAKGNETSIDALTLTHAATSAGDPGNPADQNILSLKYAGSGLSVGVIYDLTGGNAGTGKSALTETVDVTNTTGASEDLHFFEYADLNLTTAVKKSDELVINNGNTAVDAGSAGTVQESSTFTPSEVEAATGGTIKSSLNGVGPTTLNGVTGPIFGDANFAFEYDQSLAPGQSLLVSKVNTVQLNAIPLPTAAWMALAPLALLALIQTRKAKPAKVMS